MSIDPTVRSAGYDVREQPRLPESDSSKQLGADILAEIVAGLPTDVLTGGQGRIAGGAASGFTAPAKSTTDRIANAAIGAASTVVPAVLVGKLAKGKKMKSLLAKAVNMYDEVFQKHYKQNVSLYPHVSADELTGIIDPKIRDEIYKKTGWTYSPFDNRWRFEIDDSKMKLKPLKFGKKNLKLQDVISHQKLFNSYPELKQLPVMDDFDVLGYGGAAYGDRGIIIDLGELDDDTFKSYLIHEIQHAIQDIEGFARGGSPGEFMVGGRGFFDSEDMYKRLAGEWEAGLASGRVGMTAEKRAASEPFKYSWTLDDPIVEYEKDIPEWLVKLKTK